MRPEPQLSEEFAKFAGREVKTTFEMGGVTVPSFLGPIPDQNCPVLKEMSSLAFVKGLRLSFNLQPGGALLSNGTHDDPIVSVPVEKGADGLYRIAPAPAPVPKA